MDLLQGISLSVGVIGTGIAIYQWAILNEKKKKTQEIQYLFVGMSNLATSKIQKYYNLMNITLAESKDRELPKAYNMAADDFAEISSLATALESSIDPDSSASTQVLKRSIEQNKLNNQLQEEGLKNPLRKTPQSITTPSPEPDTSLSTGV